MDASSRSSVAVAIAFCAGTVLGVITTYYLSSPNKNNGCPTENISSDTNNADDSDDLSYQNKEQGREEDDTDNLKLVLVVNVDLKMRVGKIGAQCSHATLGVYEKIIESKNNNSIKLLERWKWFGQAKIVLKSPDEVTLKELQRHARALNLPTYLVADAGRTQIAAGSRTVLAIGPAPNDVINKITGHLKLL